MKQAGRFHIENGMIYGPATYMEEQGNARLERLLSGNDEVMNRVLMYQPDIEMAVLVLMQTDYAAWAGEREVFGPRNPGKAK